MSQLNRLASGWRGICLVAITYVYFLIFAQFAFLHRLATLGIADSHLKIVMAAMAIGGVVSSLVAARLHAPAPIISARLRVQIALVICATAALLTFARLNLPASLTVALLIGTGLGLLTVTLVSNLQTWLSPANPLLQVGLGTGIGYFLCNYPPLFVASPQAQALVAASLCCFALFAAAENNPPRPTKPRTQIAFRERGLPFSVVLLCFTALVWLDSAAFFIIQSTPALKAGTWSGSAHLWINAVIHLVAAIASALLLKNRGLPFVLSAAFVFLAIACLLLLDPNRALVASLFYPVGVSLYSVALVAYPALLYGPAATNDRAHRAGWIYATAGWFGSAMGIGMGQNLGHVPIAFVTAAGAIILTSQLDVILSYLREVTAVLTILALALLLHLLSRTYVNTSHYDSAIQRGRQIYISEGCINCHSQYIRPNSADVLMWGPAQTIQELRQQRPPLIGNRRQGPDLSQVGGRRSPLWLRAHFYNPQEVSHASFMPSYRYLFGDSSRGNDLIAYLSSLKSPAYAQHIQLEEAWQPPAANLTTADPILGARLFSIYCATCHDSGGLTRAAWHKDFKRLPPTTKNGFWSHIHSSDTKTQRQITLARIIKFGIPGTDMPGHEYLPDSEISDIALWLSQNISPSDSFATHHDTTGEYQ